METTHKVENILNQGQIYMMHKINFEDNIKQYAQIQLMSAIISNADTIRELKMKWDIDKIKIEDSIFNLAKLYTETLDNNI
jgi:hypothetical protein